MLIPLGCIRPCQFSSILIWLSFEIKDDSSEKFFFAYMWETDGLMVYMAVRGCRSVSFQSGSSIVS